MSLRSAEWFLVGSLLLFLFSTLVIAKIGKAFTMPSLCVTSSPPPSPPIVLVKIDGAVRRPGVYSVPQGTRVKEVLQKSRPHRFANLKAIDGNLLVEKDLELFVEPMKELRVFIQGEGLQAQEFLVPVGTKVSDLRSKIDPTPDSDLSIFKSKRMVKDGEILVIPRKGVDQK